MDLVDANFLLSRCGVDLHISIVADRQIQLRNLIVLRVFGLESFTASLLAVIPLTLLARIFAIVLKTPVTIFLLAGIFPLVPGAGIYYTAYYFIQGNNALALANGISTFKIAVALAIGIALVLGLPLPRFKTRPKR